MERQRWIELFLVGALVLSLAGSVRAQDPVPEAGVTAQAALGTAFTYQGRLTDADAPAEGSYDFRFILYDADVSGAQVGSTVLKENVPVADGYFAVQLDFGAAAFTGEVRHLEVAVRPGDSTDAHTTLSPRQPLTAAPYALALHGLWTQQNVTSPNLIGGYSGNSVANSVVGATVGGGGTSYAPNQVTADYGAVGGGEGNAAGGSYATVGGGYGNTASGYQDTVGGGGDNEASGDMSTVGGGWNNITDSFYATVGGGVGNQASGHAATVPGGEGNIAQGRSSFAAGQGAHADHDGTFVWADSSGGSFGSTGEDQFLVRAAGGVNFQTGSAGFRINGDTVWHPANVVVVAKSGGDYDSVQAALDSITDAGVDNAYLVWIAPGVYSETVTMKPYVHLQGAGQAATVITSTVNSDHYLTAATLVLASSASLRDLTVGNGGSGEYNIALLALAGTAQTLVADVTAVAQGNSARNYAVCLSGSGTSVTLQNVTALAENGTFNDFGLLNASGAATTLRGGSYTGRGEEGAWGISNAYSGTTLDAENVTALAESGSGAAFGLKNNQGAAATLRGGSFTGRGGYRAGGIGNSYSATLEAEGIIALGENASVENYGLDHQSDATASVAQSVLEGAGYSVRDTTSTVTISHSRLVGGPAYGATCVLVTRGTGPGSVSTDGSTCP